MAVRGIRGATVAKKNTEQEIVAATKELLNAIQAANITLLLEDIASFIFTVTDDLQAAFPAKAARELGWDMVPLMCAQEINVPGSLRKCIRVLIHWNTELGQLEVKHVYLREARNLRPDLFKEIEK